MAKVRKRIVALSAVIGLLFSVSLAWYNHQRDAGQRKAQYISQIIEQVNQEDPAVIIEDKDGVVTATPRPDY